MCFKLLNSNDIWVFYDWSDYNFINTLLYINNANEALNLSDIDINKTY